MLSAVILLVYFILGIIGIYGLVVAMVLKSKVTSATEGYTLDKVIVLNFSKFPLFL